MHHIKKRFSCVVHNFCFEAAPRNITRGKSRCRVVKYFSTANKGKYTDNYSLSSEEIANILKKSPKRRPSVMEQTTVEVSDPDYEVPIEEKLKKLKTLEQQSASNDAIKEIPEDNIKPASKVPSIINEEFSTHIRQPSEEEKRARPSIKYFKYGLPIPNMDPEIEGLEFFFDREKKKEKTLTQVLWEHLNLTEETPYQSYEFALQEKFNYESDMYGNIANEEELRNKLIAEKGNDYLPIKKIEDEKYMNDLRRCFTLNINMPGAMENEHPHRFLKGAVK